MHQQNWVRRRYSTEYISAQQTNPKTSSGVRVGHVTAINTGGNDASHISAPVIELRAKWFQPKWRARTTRRLTKL